MARRIPGARGGRALPWPAGSRTSRGSSSTCRSRRRRTDVFVLGHPLLALRRGLHHQHPEASIEGGVGIGHSSWLLAQRPRARVSRADPSHADRFDTLSPSESGAYSSYVPSTDTPVPGVARFASRLCCRRSGRSGHFVHQGLDQGFDRVRAEELEDVVGGRELFFERLADLRPFR